MVEFYGQWYIIDADLWYMGFVWCTYMVEHIAMVFLLNGIPMVEDISMVALWLMMTLWYINGG